MSPLAKEIIEKLSEEQDKQVLTEVLDFYEYVKQKRIDKSRDIWSMIEQDEPKEDEI